MRKALPGWHVTPVTAALLRGWVELERTAHGVLTACPPGRANNGPIRSC